ncbi:MAG: tetratricopeptide repeat protein [Elusimicrobia bacterium]|nr:tetratricopeptide repeat protein [Elusimicrobiota bacterium]
MEGFRGAFFWVSLGVWMFCRVCASAAEPYALWEPIGVPWSAQVWFRWGEDPLTGADQLFRDRRYPEAAQEASKKLRSRLRRADQRRAYWILGKSYEILGRLDQALGVYQVAVELFPGQAPLQVALGGVYEQVGLWERARATYGRAVQVQPYYAWGHWGLGRVEESFGFYERAASSYHLALEGELREHSELRFRLAHCLRKAGRWREALSILTGLLAQVPDPQYFLELAYIQKSLGDWDQAFVSLRKAEAYPESPPELAFLRLAWLWEEGREEVFQKELEVLQKKFPENLLANFFEFLVALREGDWDEARRQMRQFRRKSPSKAVAAYAQALESALQREDDALR